MMADIFNGLDRNTENKFMSGLEDRNRESAEKIKSLMFTFDDLAKVDAAGVQVILRQVEKDQLAMALKGGSDDLKDLFFGNMSERAGKMMKEDMEAMGAVRLRDVDEAQSAIVQVAKGLADAGEIAIATGGEDDEFVY
jgi:flagellar motor switch protein FliG